MSRKDFRFTAWAAVLSVVAAYAAPAAAQIEIAKDRAVKSDLAAKRLLLGVTRAGKRLVTVGEFGHVLLSDNQGRTWRQAKAVPTNTTLTAVSFADADHGWAVGHDATILHTEDGGETWQRQFVDEDTGNPLLSVLAFDRARVLAVGAFARLMETQDGGKTWITRPVAAAPAEGETAARGESGGSNENTVASDAGLTDEPVENHLNGLFRGPNGSVFVAAEFGAVFRSTDNGATFTMIKSGYQGSFWGGISLGDGSLLAFGMRGNVWRSSDLGLTWTRLQSELQQSISGAVELDDGTVVLAGLGGTVLYSHDRGRTLTGLILPNRKALAAVAAGDGNHVNLFGEAGVARYTIPARKP